MRISSVNLPHQNVFYTGKISEAKQRELNARSKRVKATLQKAISEDRKMTIEEIAKASECSIDNVKYVFKRYSAVRALWKNVCIRPLKMDRRTPEEIEEKKEEIKGVLSEAKSSGKVMSVIDLAAAVDSTAGAIGRYVKDEGLGTLWFWVKTKDVAVFTKEEMAEQTAKIKEQLELAIEQKKAITIPEITEATGIEGCVIDNRINADETLTALRNQTLEFEDKNRKLELRLIKETLKEAEESGLKITQVYISEKTNIPVSTVQKRISENASLERLFNKVRAKEHNYNSQDEILSQNAEIAAILNQVIEGGQKITISDLAAKYPKLKQDTIMSRLGRYPELTALWAQAKVESEVNYNPDKDAIKKQTERIEEILTELKDKNERITGKKLADMVGITQRMALARIKKSEKLSALWEATCSVSNAQYTEEEIEVQEVMIERILTRRIQDKTKPSIYQMSQYLDLSSEILKRRIKNNTRLSALYQRSQQV